MENTYTLTLGAMVRLMDACTKGAEYSPEEIVDIILEQGIVSLQYGGEYFVFDTADLVLV